MKPQAFPAWLPPNAVEWAEQIGQKQPRKLARVAPVMHDARMEMFWRWHDATLDKRTSGARYDEWTLLFMVDTALKLPGKPSNMSKAKREAYFASVRRHAEKLLELLEGTIYESGSLYHGKRRARPIAQHELVEKVLLDLRVDEEWFYDVDGRIVAYVVDQDGVSRLPWGYPECELVDRLHDVVTWTRQDSGWANDFLTSSQPLDHAKESNALVTFFVCNMFDGLGRYGIKLPFGHLATLANVALGLEQPDQLDEEAARKTVRRHAIKSADSAMTDAEWDALWSASEETGQKN